MILSSSDHFDETLSLRTDQLDAALRVFVDAPWRLGDELTDVQRHALETMVALPDDPLELELLNALLTHAPKRSLTEVDQIRGIEAPRSEDVSSADHTDDEFANPIQELQSVDKTMPNGSQASHLNAEDRSVVENVSYDLGSSPRSESFSKSAQSQLRRSLLEERLAVFSRVVPRIRATKKSQALEVVPLSALNLQLHEIWRVYIPLAMILHDLANAHARDFPNKAFLLGLNAPPGCGKSTLVQIIKFLLLELAEMDRQGIDGVKPRVCIAVSQDDFYRTKADRKQRGIHSRAALEGMDTELCYEILQSLCDRTRKVGVEVPRFSKALDDREPKGTVMEDPVDIVLYEGWRLGIDHPNYIHLMKLPDFLICIDASLREVRQWKFEQVERDCQQAGVPFDGESLSQLWENEVVPVIEKYSGRVKERADLVFSEETGHLITRISGRVQSFAHEFLNEFSPDPPSR